MINPRAIWQSPIVTQLLDDFYAINFDKAGIQPGLATKIVQTGWEKKDTLQESELMKEINSYFDSAKKQAYTGITETSAVDFFDYSQVHTFLDYGANKLKILNGVGYKNPSISKLIAVDVVPQKLHFAYPNRSEYFHINPDASNLSLPKESVDFINIQFVMHHIQEELFEPIFKKLSAILKPGGRLVLWEETFEDSIDVEKVCVENHARGSQMSTEFTKRFYNLSESERFEFIIVNDWLINVNNEHMQWTGTYKTWTQWVELLSKYHFSLKKTFNLGLRVNGIIKQGVHVVGEFVKN
jgi:ubiquinone/menaquinone biosynthesis C-methylase UbiE